MIVLSLGRWDHAAGRWFVRSRIRKDGYKWTPFARIEWRRSDWSNFWLWLASKMPKRLIYFCAIQFWVHGTTGKYSGTNTETLTISDALHRYEKDNAL